jgi:membrane-bound lytic murein transglycosylase D
VLADPAKGHSPPESRRYIRKVLAISLLATDDAFLSAIQYDKFVTDSPDNQIATVYLPEGEDIDRIAAVLEMPKTHLKKLNTHLKKGVTPPNASAYPVYIPQDKLDEFRQKYRTRELKGYFVMHRVKSGETLTNLSSRYNVPRGAIMMENMIGSNTELLPNRNVRIPINKPFLKNPRWHTVKSGETLASVAALYNMTLEQIKAKNPFTSSTLNEGEEVKVGD